MRETRGGPDGTLIASVIEDALGDVAPDRIGAVVVVTDGQAADPPEEPRRLAAFGPAHVLIVGDPERGDRRLELIAAPTFGIVGEAMRLSARVVDSSTNGNVRVNVSIDGAPATSASVRANRPFELEVRLPRRGRNMVIIEAEAGAQEITLANNRAAFAANGVRDRLRVRFGLEAKVSPTLLVGIGIATGEGRDSRSTNSTLDSASQNEEIGLDLAYVDWRPRPDMLVTLGKQRHLY